jgi:hypothetical protein
VRIESDVVGLERVVNGVRFAPESRFRIPISSLKINTCGLLVGQREVWVQNKNFSRSAAAKPPKKYLSFLLKGQCILAMITGRLIIDKIIL